MGKQARSTSSSECAVEPGQEPQSGQAPSHSQAHRPLSTQTRWALPEAGLQRGLWRGRFEGSQLGLSFPMIFRGTDRQRGLPPQRAFSTWNLLGFWDSEPHVGNASHPQQLPPPLWQAPELPEDAHNALPPALM